MPDPTLETVPKPTEKEHNEGKRLRVFTTDGISETREITNDIPCFYCTKNNCAKCPY